MNKLCLTLFVGLVCLSLLPSGRASYDDGGSYKVRFNVQLTDTERNEFVLEVYPSWAPLGAARFRELLDSNFFVGVHFFRVIPGFVAQFGISGNPHIAAQWLSKTIPDDPVQKSNKRGTLTFATSGPDSRTTQLFLNFRDNNMLDSQGFAPFAEVTSSSMDTVDRITSRYREQPDQGQIQRRGNDYLDTNFPGLSYIINTEVL